MNLYRAEKLIEQMRARPIAEARQRLEARAMSLREDAPLEAERKVEATLDRLDCTVEEYRETVDGLWRRPRLAQTPILKLPRPHSGRSPAP